MKTKSGGSIFAPLFKRLMLPEALVLSGYYRYIILHRPFSSLAKKIGTFGYETAAEEENRDVICAVRRAVGAVCKRTPWESKCLVRALTAKKMLNRRKCKCTLYMGVRQNENGNMYAHAWLRCGNMYVSGGMGEGYTVTGIFGDNG